MIHMSVTKVRIGHILKVIVICVKIVGSSFIITIFMVFNTCQNTCGKGERVVGGGRLFLLFVVFYKAKVE